MAKVTKTVSRETAANWLGSISDPDKQFWCCDGRIFRSLQELRDGLKDMQPDIVLYHANQEKNDFASWVRDVIGDNELSAKLAQAKTAEEALKVLSNRIGVLKRKLTTT